MANIWPWRRKSEGFEWHKYVRTTIALRREHRREKAEELKRSAADGAARAAEGAARMARQSASAAGEGARRVSVSTGRGLRSFLAAAGTALWRAFIATGHGLRILLAASGTGLRRFLAATGRGVQRGHSASGHGLRVGGRAAGAGAGVAGRSFVAGTATGLSWIGANLGVAGRAAGGGIAEVSRPLVDVLGRPGVSGPLMWAGGVALLSGLGRPFLSGGVDREAILAATIGALLLLAGLTPRLQYGAGSAVVDWIAAPFRRLPPRVGQMMAGGGAVAVAIAATVWMLPGKIGLPSLPDVSLSSFVPFAASDPPITGRASVVSADTLRIGHVTIRLDGIEAPEAEQTCARSGHRVWRCGEAAQSALSRLISGRKLRCEPSGKDASGTVRAACFSGSSDVAGALVKGGHVFAESGMMARYGSEQSAAREAKAGLWSSASEPERPAAWRSRLWEEARARAPKGCPIKGKVAGRGEGAKTYHLPWSPIYGRLRVVPARGERWFCSEDEARGAGFAPSAVDG
jgi:endonuclease YncB( thermonuclease family)